MPRRTATRCTRRYAGDTIGTVEELCLLWGHCFGIRDWEEALQSRPDFSRLWSRWGAELVTRWVAAYPGSRPLGCYVAREILPPAWRHEIPALRHPVRIGGEVVIEDRAWHGHEVELDHLVEIGVVTGDEYEAAVERLAGGQPTDVHRYEALARDD
jgi:hypothetical protein